MTYLSAIGETVDLPKKKMKNGKSLSEKKSRSNVVHVHEVHVHGRA